MSRLALYEVQFVREVRVLVEAPSKEKAEEAAKVLVESGDIDDPEWGGQWDWFVSKSKLKKPRRAEVYGAVEGELVKPEDWEKRKEILDSEDPAFEKDTRTLPLFPNDP